MNYCTVAAFPLGFWALAHLTCISLVQRQKHASLLGKWLCQNTVRRCFCWYTGIFSEQFGCLQEADLSSQGLNIQHQASMSPAQCCSTGKAAATLLNILTHNMQTGSNSSSSQCVFPVERIQMTRTRKTKLDKHAQRGSLMDCKGGNLTVASAVPYRFHCERMSAHCTVMFSACLLLYVKELFIACVFFLYVNTIWGF